MVERTRLMLQYIHLPVLLLNHLENCEIQGRAVLVIKVFNFYPITFLVRQIKGVPFM